MTFIDRSIPKSVALALKAVRDDVLWLEDRFAHDTRDEERLTTAGAENWLVISRDKRIRTRPAEREAIINSDVGCFILNQSRDPTRWEYLKLLALTLDEMVTIFERTERPFIYSVGRSGNISRVV